MAVRVDRGRTLWQFGWAKRFRRLSRADQLLTLHLVFGTGCNQRKFKRGGLGRGAEVGVGVEMRAVVGVGVGVGAAAEVISVCSHSHGVHSVHRCR